MKKPLGSKIPASKDQITPDYRNVFVVSALSMTWQLAIVVIVPIVGGNELDQHLHTSPWLLVVGFVIAMAGTMYVIRKALRQANQKVGK